ncbi:MAG: efflux RND transporter permease subunit [Planctomycetaceae bacterium]|nr:efflux RND transporter permease subunit [Planctomycetaceae bacterium]
MFSHFFIDRPIFASVVSLIILLLGIVGFSMLPVEQFPDIVPPMVSVQASYPGASAQDVINAVAIPIEEVLNGVDNMIYMETQATSNGTLSINISFEVGTDPDIAAVLVQNRVKQAEPILPEEVRRMGISVNKRSANFVCLVTIFEKIDEEDPHAETRTGQYLANYASLFVKDRLSRVAGVGDVMMFDRRQFSMRVWLDVDVMAARGISVREVLAAIRAQNTQVAAGRLGLEPVPDGIQTNVAVVTLGRLEDAEQFENMILRVDEQGGTLRLKDVALIELGSADYTAESRYNGRMATGIAVMPQSGANVLVVADAVVQLMASIDDSLGRSGLTYAIPFNATDYVRATVHEFYETIVLCVCFVVFVIFLFLQDWRAAIIPILTIPVSIIGTFFLIWCFGFSINTMTLFGLILVIGIVVDDAIVVVENTQRLIDDEHLDAHTAAKKSMTQVTGPVVASVLIMLAVFLPTSMMQGIVGALYQQFALTIAGSITISGICALTLSPALCAILLRPSKAKEKRFIVFRGFNYFFDGFTNFYQRTVKMMIWCAPLVLLLWVGLVFGLIFAVQRLPSGFLPNEDQGVIMMEVRLPEGASMERTTEVLSRVERIITREQTLVRSEDYYKRGIIRRLYEQYWDKNRTYVESGGVKSAVYINGFSFIGGQAANLGMVIIPLEVWDDRRAQGWSITKNRMDAGLKVGAIQARLEKELNATIPEAYFMLFTPPPIQVGMTNGVAYVLLDERGVGPTVLAGVRDDIQRRAVDFNPIVAMISSFNPNSPQISFDIDRDKAQRMGINLSEVFAALQSYLGVAYVNDFNMLGRTFRVNVQAKGEFRDSVESALRIKVQNNQGEMVPLGAFTTEKYESGPQVLTRYNMFPSAAMTGVIRPGASTSDGIERMEELSREFLPDGFSFAWTGLTFQEKRVGNQTAIFFAVSVLITFLILAAQYESWSSPFIIMMAVPLGVFGAIFATVVFAMYAVGFPASWDFMSLVMWVMNAEINLYTQIGLLLMVGLSAKNAVLIVEFARKRRDTGAGLVQSAYEAGRLRLRPIFMTSFAFILGVLPLVWSEGAGGYSRNAIGNCVFGGLLMETMVGVYVTPVLFVIIQGMSEWFYKHVKSLLHSDRKHVGKAPPLDEVNVRHGI